MGQQPGQTPKPGLIRHQARVIALQVLFEFDLTNHGVEVILTRQREDTELPPDVETYATKLVRGVLRDRPALDDAIGAAAPAFPVEQMPAVDRNILRVALYEIRNERDVPVKAAINEAVELAKHFGGDNSSRFVNGVLGTIVGGREQ
jgi:transcription antitermination protein NusB